MGVRKKQILALALSGLLIMADETVADAATIILFEDNGSQKVAEKLVAADTETVSKDYFDSDSAGSGNFVEITGETKTQEINTDALEESSGETQTADGVAAEADSVTAGSSDAAEDTGGVSDGATEATDESEEPEEKIEITTNEDGQTVYRLLADVEEGLKIDMTEGETVIVEGNGNTIHAADNGIYATGNGTLVIEDVTVLGGDSTSGIGVLDKDVNITLSGTVAVEELYFGGNTLTLTEGADVTLYGRGAQVQSLYYTGNSFEEEANATLTLVQGKYENSEELMSAKHISVAYGNDIACVNYVTDQEEVLAGVVLPALTVENHKFSGWYMDGNYNEEYTSETVASDGMVLYAKYVDGKGRAEPIELAAESAEQEETDADATLTEAESTGTDGQKAEVKSAVENKQAVTDEESPESTGAEGQKAEAKSAVESKQAVTDEESTGAERQKAEAKSAVESKQAVTDEESPESTGAEGQKAEAKSAVENEQAVTDEVMSEQEKLLQTRQQIPVLLEGIVCADQSGGLVAPSPSLWEDTALEDESAQLEESEPASLSMQLGVSAALWEDTALEDESARLEESKPASLSMQSGVSAALWGDTALEDESARLEESDPASQSAGGNPEEISGVFFAIENPEAEPAELREVASLSMQSGVSAILWDESVKEAEPLELQSGVSAVLWDESVKEAEPLELQSGVSAVLWDESVKEAEPLEVQSGVSDIFWTAVSTGGEVRSNETIAKGDCGIAGLPDYDSQGATAPVKDKTAHNLLWEKTAVESEENSAQWVRRMLKNDI